MRESGKCGKHRSLRRGLVAALAVTVVLLPAIPRAGPVGKRSQDSGWIKGIDTAWQSPYLRGDTLWSSPYDGPATPGTGLPGKSGYGWPATGSGKASGAGGSGMDGMGIPQDSSRIPGTGPSPASPGDTIGILEWMERG